MTASAFLLTALAPRTLVDVLADTVRRHPDAPAIDDGNTTTTYRGLPARRSTRPR